jgi:wyosine [tRNA(Phe)-imidazoG37] synthetase (radical SAM superfamily)
VLRTSRAVRQATLQRQPMSGTVRRHVYGPVPSRRLGRSLGVDLVPFKTCTYDCIYCQLGRTTDSTVVQQHYTSADDILEQLRKKLRAVPLPDYVSLAGSGEPTLHAGIGDLIARIKRLTSIPVAVLTNGSLLAARKIQDALLEADLILPSLDAGDAELFRLVNRPHPDIEFDSVVDGLVAFRERFTKPIWLEIMLLAGITGNRSEVEKIAALARRIHPDRIQLNTVTRPPCEEYAYPVPSESLASFARLFGHTAQVVSDYKPRRGRPAGSATEGDILALLARRPCTVQGIADGLGLHVNEVAKHLDILTNRDAVIPVRKNGSVFFEIVRGA